MLDVFRRTIIVFEKPARSHLPDSLNNSTLSSDQAVNTLQLAEYDAKPHKRLVSKAITSSTIVSSIERSSFDVDPVPSPTRDALTLTLELLSFD